MGTEPYQTQQDARRAIFNLPEWFPTFRRIKTLYGPARADMSSKNHLSWIFLSYSDVLLYGDCR
jgi:hypothetical protein